MPANNVDPGFTSFVAGATQDIAKDLGSQKLIGKADQIQGGQGPGTHGVNIAQRIGRCHGPKVIRPVHNRCEKIGRQHQGHVVIELVDRGIIGCGTSHQHFRIGDFCQFAQQEESDSPEVAWQHTPLAWPSE